MSAADKKFLHSLLLAGAEHDAIQNIRRAFGSYEAAWRASASSLQTAGLSPERVAAIARASSRAKPDEAMRLLVSQGVALVTEDDAEFPKELATAAAPPLFLYIKGRLDLKKPRLAVVGTRKATAYGREATRKIIRELAEEAEVVIVSGLAQGIDAEAHKAALECGLATVGVLGGGMDRPSFFPPENWNLAEEIVVKGGTLISEYPPGTPALKHHFPARNRIIAGLSQGVLVAEAPEKSGTLITAHFALEQGREVFAIPGPLFSPTAGGVHRLIQDGAKLVTSAADIAEELGLERRIPKERIATSLTDHQEKIIWEFLSASKSVDEIKAKTNLPTANIVSCLSALELKGLVRPMGQNRFQRIK